MAEYPKVEEFQPEPVSDYLPGEESPEPVTSNSLQWDYRAVAHELSEEAVKILVEDRNKAQRRIRELKAQLAEAKERALDWRDKEAVTARQRDEWVDWCKKTEAERDAAESTARTLNNLRIADRHEIEMYQRDLKESQAEVARLRAALEEVEWVHDSYQNMGCPWCSNEEDEGHHPDCARQSALSPEKKDEENPLCVCNHRLNTHNPCCVSACGCDEFVSADKPLTDAQVDPLMAAHPPTWKPGDKWESVEPLLEELGVDKPFKSE